jgi:hypothetical protein
MGLERLLVRARRYILELDYTIVGSWYERLTIWRERDYPNRATMPLKHLLVYARRCILEPDNIGGWSQRERLAIRRERDYINRAAMPLERLPVRILVVSNTYNYLDK